MEAVTTLSASSLFTAFRKHVQASQDSGDTLVPVDDFAAYCLLANEMARMASADSSQEVYAWVDAHTAVQVDAVGAVLATARRVYLFGSAPESWAGARNLAVTPHCTCCTDHDLFLVVISTRFAVALLCEQGPGGLRGAWTTDRSHAGHLAETLSAAAGIEWPADGPVVAESPHDDYAMACAVRLSALHARQLNQRQRDITMDKNDLSSVLNILKAVSSNRRAHDILFVFVEQIARAVSMDRCSVVRVWGGDDTGHVLASHEDEHISDVVIDLKKYPEIRRAMEIRQKVIINDTRRDPLMRPVLGEVTQAGIASLVVIPIVLFDQNVGSFLLRAARMNGHFSLREISFCEIVAEAAANALERAHLFESIQKANERLERLAITDGLTGLYNHRYFIERLEAEFERARRYALPLSCMIADIDDFKKVNDTFGHLQGDMILRAIAATTLQTVRKSDIVARYGGEEFVVIMAQTGIDGAKAQAERLRRRIEHEHFEGLPEESRVTVSIGVAVFQPENMFDYEALIRGADGALYTAKREGKNRVVVAQP